MNNVQPKTEKGVRASLEGWPIVHPKNMVVHEVCRRCDEKNDLRIQYDMETEDAHLEIGDRVRGFAYFNEEKGVWQLSAVHHERHPVVDREEVAEPNTAQARVVGRVNRRGWTYESVPRVEDQPDYYFVEDQAVLEDVAVEWLSPEGEGEEREPIREPDEHGLVELKPTDPRPGWPEEDNEWRKDIMMRHGDWDDEVETVTLEF